MTAALYPAAPSERTQWIIEKRPPRREASFELPHAFFSEQELSRDGKLAQVATILLTNRECPWTCVMCDLWKNAARTATPPGMIPKQIESALSALPNCSSVKLYNSGSFFDAGAIPHSDWPEIARLCSRLDVVVECHPRLVNQRAVEFAQLLDGRLEVALGLETANPRALEALNKRFTLEDYRHAAAFLKKAGMGVRTFLLVHPPFLPPGTETKWLEESIRFAFDCGSEVVSLIPLRHGNGAVNLVASEPSLADLEEAHETGLDKKRGRVFADTWDLGRFSRCGECAAPRTARLIRMNLSQAIEPRINCDFCGGR